MILGQTPFTLGEINKVKTILGDSKFLSTKIEELMNFLEEVKNNKEVKSSYSKEEILAVLGERENGENNIGSQPFARDIVKCALEDILKHNN